MMTRTDRRHLTEQRDVLEIFRRCREHNMDGPSWILDRSRADWFTKRFADVAFALVGRSRRDDMLAYFDSVRNESEIVVLPPVVDITDRTRAKRKRRSEAVVQEEAVYRRINQKPS